MAGWFRSFEYEAAFPLANSFVIRMKCIYCMKIDCIKFNGWPWQHDPISHNRNLTHGNNHTWWRLLPALPGMSIVLSAAWRQLSRGRHRLAEIASLQIANIKYWNIIFQYTFDYKFRSTKLLITNEAYLMSPPLHTNRKKSQVSCLHPPRGRLSGIELRTGWYNKPVQCSGECNVIYKTNCPTNDRDSWYVGL
jgi:hypothetical protein